LSGSTEFAAGASFLTVATEFAAVVSLLTTASEVSTASSPPHPFNTKIPDASRKNRIELSIRKLPKNRGCAARRPKHGDQKEKTGTEKEIT
jgi:hypothetical protein